MTCRWYLSARAVSEFARICRMGDPERDEVFDLAEDELMKLVETATLKEEQRNGLECWRALIPPAYRLPGSRTERRLQLLVSHAVRVEGDLPQLVSVRVQGQR